MRNSERCGLERRWRLSYSIQYSTVACVDTIRTVRYHTVGRMVQGDGEGSPISRCWMNGESRIMRVERHERGKKGTFQVT